MAADSTTIANPVCTQISTTMRNSVFHGSISSHCWGVPPNHTMIWFSRPIWGYSEARYS